MTFNYDPLLSVFKGFQSGAITGVSGIAGALLGAGISYLRSSGIADWDPAQDAELISAMMLIGSTAGSAARRTLSNYRKHG